MTILKKKPKMTSKLPQPTYLFSVGTHFAKKINETYYNNTHYVWCTTHYDSKKQPVTSNPKSICKRWLELVHTGDRHAVEFSNNLAGILRGAQAKLEQGVIDQNQFSEIGQLINLAKYKDFFPVIYIIDINKVGQTRCKEVPIKDRASDNSIEYKVEDLAAGEFQVIELKTLFQDLMDSVDKKIGE